MPSDIAPWHLAALRARHDRRVLGALEAVAGYGTKRSRRSYDKR